MDDVFAEAFARVMSRYAQSAGATPASGVTAAEIYEEMRRIEADRVRGDGALEHGAGP